MIERDKDAYKYRDKADYVLSVVLSADEKTLFSGSDDYTIKIWEKKCETSYLEKWGANCSLSIGPSAMLSSDALIMLVNRVSTERAMNRMIGVI